MSSIITSILSSTVGLLMNKARDTVAEKLKDGGVTDAQIRQIVVRELNDIKTKLDGLSRKDLLSSYCFLQEGVSLLNASLDKTKIGQQAELNEAQDDLGVTSIILGGTTETGIFNEALQLAAAMRKVKIDSDKEFESATERFKEARKTATHAFCNETLSIQDRLFAAKVRIISEILECLESPKTAITGCLSFLEKLHSLPAVQDMFSVYLNGGIKSMLNKAERVENVKSVMLINQVLSHYCSKFGSGNYSYLVWPAIELAGRSFNPVLNWQEVSTRKSMGNELTQPPNELILNDEAVYPENSAVNGQGTTAFVYTHSEFKVISKRGESRVVKLPDPREDEVRMAHMKALAVDNNSNTYVVRKHVTEIGFNVIRRDVLYVLDENYNLQHYYALDFLEATDHTTKMAINKNNDIIMIREDDPHVYVCDSTGQFKHKFKRDACWGRSLCISDSNEIMMLSDNRQAVDIYTEEGEKKSTIKVPEGHEARGVAYHHVIRKIIILTYFKKTNSLFLLCFSETGELEASTLFGEWEYPFPDITSHPSGPAAVLRSNSITFI